MHWSDPKLRAVLGDRYTQPAFQLQLIGQQRQVCTISLSKVTLADSIQQIEVLRELDQLNVVSRAEFKQRLSQHIQQKRDNRPLVLAIQGST